MSDYMVECECGYESERTNLNKREAEETLNEHQDGCGEWTTVWKCVHLSKLEQ